MVSQWDGKQDRRREPKADNIIWWLMVTFLSVILIGGGAWCTNIWVHITKIEETLSIKSERMATLEANVIFIVSQLSEIKERLKEKNI